MRHVDKEKTLKAENQIMISMSRVTQQLQETLSDLSRTRVDFQNSEVTQQMKNESQREFIFNMTEKEDKLSESESSLNDLWNAIEEKHDVREIYTMLENLKALYSVTIQRKDVLIKELRQRISNRDEDYLKCLKEGESRINYVRSTIDQSLISMENAFKTELEAIKDVFNEDRYNIMMENEKAVTQLFSENSALAKQNVDQLVVNYEENEDQKMMLHDELDSEFDSLKTKLLEDVAKLEIELSVSKCLYETNIDQIGYNLRDLNTKNDENLERIKKRRKRISQFKEQLRREVDRFRITDSQDTKKILTLETDCKRLESQHRNLVSKLHRFELMEDQKYQSAMSMYKEEESNLKARMKQSNISISKLLTGTENEENEEKEEDDFISQLEKAETVLVKYNMLLEEASKRRKSIEGMRVLNVELQSSLIDAETTDVGKSLIIASL